MGISIPFGYNNLIFFDFQSKVVSDYAKAGLSGEGSGGQRRGRNDEGSGGSGVRGSDEGGRRGNGEGGRSGTTWAA